MSKWIQRFCKVHIQERDCTGDYYLVTRRVVFGVTDISGRMLENFQDLQARPQSQRLQILKLLNSLMSNYRAAIKSLADESLVGIIELVSGEKDPRNLMMIFSILKVIMVEWDVVAHAEVCCEVVVHGELLILPDAFRFRLLLLPHHFPSTPRRPLWYLCTGSQSSPTRVHRFVPIFCTICISSAH